MARPVPIDTDQPCRLMGRLRAAAPWARGALRFAFVLLTLLLAARREAHAYTDPGTGALAWQILAAAFVGLMFYIRKFTSLFSKKKKNSNNEPPDAA